MSRIVVIGNAGGGKSTLSRKLATARGLRHIEIDRLLWQEGWTLTPPDVYTRQHEAVIASDDWLFDGLGQQSSIPPRIARATEVILIDLPLWMHFWLAAERQMAWAAGTLDQPPAGISDMPPTKALFQSIWDVDRNWMVGVRRLCDEAESLGKTVVRLRDLSDIDRFAQRDLRFGGRERPARMPAQRQSQTNPGKTRAIAGPAMAASPVSHRMDPGS